MATINIAMANSRKEGNIQRVRVFQVEPVATAAAVELKRIAEFRRRTNSIQAAGARNASSKRNQTENG
jgi:hypothetical protein